MSKGDMIHDKMRDAIFDTAVSKGQVGYLMVAGIRLGTDGSAVDMETGEPATVEQRMAANDILNKSLTKPWTSQSLPYLLP